MATATLALDTLTPAIQIEFRDRAVETMTTQPMSMERRLALLLRDGSGDFDFIHLHSARSTLWLQGDLRSYALERKAVELAEKVGFTRVINRIGSIPATGATIGQDTDEILNFAEADMSRHSLGAPRTEAGDK